MIKNNKRDGNAAKNDEESEGSDKTEDISSPKQNNNKECETVSSNNIYIKGPSTSFVSQSEPSAKFSNSGDHNVLPVDNRSLSESCTDAIKNVLLGDNEENLVTTDSEIENSIGPKCNLSGNIFLKDNEKSTVSLDTIAICEDVSCDITKEIFQADGDQNTSFSVIEDDDIQKALPNSEGKEFNKEILTSTVETSEDKAALLGESANSPENVETGSTTKLEAMTDSICDDIDTLNLQSPNLLNTEKVDGVKSKVMSSFGKDPKTEDNKDSHSFNPPVSRVVIDVLDELKKCFFGLSWKNILPSVDINKMSKSEMENLIECGSPESLKKYYLRSQIINYSKDSESFFTFLKVYEIACVYIDRNEIFNPELENLVQKCKEKHVPVLYIPYLSRVAAHRNFLDEPNCSIIGFKKCMEHYQQVSQLYKLSNLAYSSERNRKFKHMKRIRRQKTCGTQNLQTEKLNEESSDNSRILPSNAHGENNLSNGEDIERTGHTSEDKVPLLGKPSTSHENDEAGQATNELGLITTSICDNIATLDLQPPDSFDIKRVCMNSKDEANFNQGIKAEDNKPSESLQNTFFSKELIDVLDQLKKNFFGLSWKNIFPLVNINEMSKSQLEDLIASAEPTAFQKFYLRSHFINCSKDIDFFLKFLNVYEIACVFIDLNEQGNPELDNFLQKCQEKYVPTLYVPYLSKVAAHRNFLHESNCRIIGFKKCREHRRQNSRLCRLSDKAFIAQKQGRSYSTKNKESPRNCNFTRYLQTEKLSNDKKIFLSNSQDYHNNYDGRFPNESDLADETLAIAEQSDSDEKTIQTNEHKSILFGEPTISPENHDVKYQITDELGSIAASICDTFTALDLQPPDSFSIKRVCMNSKDEANFGQGIKADNEPSQSPQNMIVCKEIIDVLDELKHCYYGLNWKNIFPLVNMNELSKSEMEKLIASAEPRNFLKYTLRSQIINGSKDINSIFKFLKGDQIACVHFDINVKGNQELENLLQNCEEKNVPVLCIPYLSKIVAHSNFLDEPNCSIIGLKRCVKKRKQTYHLSRLIRLTDKAFRIMTGKKRRQFKGKKVRKNKEQAENLNNLSEQDKEIIAIDLKAIESTKNENTNLRSHKDTKNTLENGKSKGKSYKKENHKASNSSSIETLQEMNKFKNNKPQMDHRKTSNPKVNELSQEMSNSKIKEHPRDSVRAKHTQTRELAQENHMVEPATAREHKGNKSRLTKASEPTLGDEKSLGANNTSTLPSTILRILPSIQPGSYDTLIRVLKASIHGLQYTGKFRPRNLYNMGSHEGEDFLDWCKLNFPRMYPIVEARSHLKIANFGEEKMFSKDIYANKLIMIYIQSPPASSLKHIITASSKMGIPVIPLKDFAEIVGNPETLCLPRCSVLALKESSLDRRNGFYGLYTISCKAIDKIPRPGFPVQQMRQQMQPLLGFPQHY